jgi:hypothetical protein
MAQVIEYLPNKCKAPSSGLSPETKKKGGGGAEGKGGGGGRGEK